MEILKDELKNFLKEKNLQDLLNEHNVGVIMVNSKKINHDSEIEFFPMIIEKKGEFYVIYNCLFKREIIIYNDMKSVSILNESKIHFSVSKNLKISDFENALKQKFSSKKIIYIK